MNFKKIIALLLCLSSILSVCSLTACKNDDVPPVTDDTGDGEPQPEPPAPEVPLDINAINKRSEVLQPLSNNFLSRTETVYKNINGGDVTAYNFYVEPNENSNNPNFSQALLIYQCIKYKEAHPEADVNISIATFHFSVVFAACLDRNSPEFGKVKSLYDSDYTSDSYYRLSYLCVEAARKGINITVVGQLDASPVIANPGGTMRDDYSFDEYFTSHLNDPAYIEGKKVSDFMTYRKCDWTSYNDKSATDMMHLKACTVSNYIDFEGKEHGGSVWFGSINIDGIHYNGVNGHNSIQSGIIISDHEELRRVTYNYTNLIADNCGQEDVLTFRNIVSTRLAQQIDRINAGNGRLIPKDEQIIYLGTETDSVFRLYFTPFGGTQNAWDTKYNPYCKYIEKMWIASEGDDYIEFIWNNVKYNQSFDLADTFAEMIAASFIRNSNTQIHLHLQLPGIDTSCFNGLIEGENIGVNSVNEYGYGYHIKDVQLSYVENGVRHYVTLFNSLNFHEGSMSYQSNFFLVIDETDATGNNIYTNYAIMTTPGIDFECHRVLAK